MANVPGYIKASMTDGIEVNGGFAIKDQLKDRGFEYNRDEKKWSRKDQMSEKDMQWEVANLKNMGCKYDKEQNPKEKAAIEKGIKERGLEAPKVPERQADLARMSENPPVIKVDADKGKLSVENGYPIKDELKKLGFKYNEDGKSWEKGFETNKDVEKLQDSVAKVVDKHEKAIGKKLGVKKGQEMSR